MDTGRKRDSRRVRKSVPIDKQQHVNGMTSNTVTVDEDMHRLPPGVLPITPTFADFYPDPQVVEDITNSTLETIRELIADAIGMEEAIRRWGIANKESGAAMDTNFDTEMRYYAKRLSRIKLLHSMVIGLGLPNHVVAQIMRNEIDRLFSTQIASTSKRMTIR